MLFELSGSAAILTPKVQPRHFVVCGAFHRGRRTRDTRNKKIPDARHAGTQVTDNRLLPDEQLGGWGGGNARRAL
jgi:hypothetical protein